MAGDQELPPLEELGEGVPPVCAPYQDEPEVFGYCLYKVAGGLPSVELLDAMCSQAGDWEADCRHAWVAGNMKDPEVPLETLIEACGGNADCTFELIDMRVSDDVVEQIERCQRWVLPYLDDCVGHAMQRWYLTKPDAEEHARLANTVLPGADRVGHFLGANVACREVGTCEAATSPTTSRCQKAVEHFERNPSSCPSDSKQVLFHNQHRTAPDGMSSPKGKQPGAAPGGTPQGQGGRPRGLPPGTPPPSHGGG